MVRSFDSLDRIPKANHYTTAYASLAAVLFLFIAGISGTLYVLNFHSGFKTNPDGLQLTDIRFRELIGRNQQKVVRVEGVIANNSQDLQKVPRITLSLKQGNGEDVFQWYYQPSIQQLSPGKKSLFASSILSNEPVISTVSAHFEY
ncbi:MAG: hypothetical protein AAF217_05575 [Pseudomonadota bacterium]